MNNWKNIERKFDNIVKDKERFAILRVMELEDGNEVQCGVAVIDRHNISEFTIIETEGEHIIKWDKGFDDDLRIKLMNVL